MKNFLKLFKSPLLYLSIIAVGFFFIYSYPRMVLPLINLSPDENANYFFSKLAAEKGTLMSYERLNEGIAPIVHPRSINVNQENYLVPGSFLGIILIYGFFAKIFGSNAIIFLTPFFACLGALFFYGIIKRIFSWQAAFISSCLMLAHPAFWYYSTRSMFHNVLFLSLLMIGIYFLINIKEIRNWKLEIGNFNLSPIIYIILAGLFIGLALIVRTSEAPWVFGALLVIWLFYFRKVRLFEAILLLSAIALPFIPIIYYNQSLYGSPILTGYANLHKGEEMVAYVEKEAESQDGCDSDEAICKISFLAGETGRGLTPLKGVRPQKESTVFNKIREIAIRSVPTSFDLNINLRTAARNFKNYYLKFFKWLSLLTLAGAGFFILRLIAAIALKLARRKKSLIDMPGENKAEECFGRTSDGTVAKCPRVIPNGAERSEGSPRLSEKIRGFFVASLLRMTQNTFWRDASNEEFKAQFAYLLLFALISAYLIIYYGSWVFNDAPDPKLITIGTSYTRYWLPVYVMGLPFIGFLLEKLSSALKFRFPKFIFMSIVSIALAAYCAILAYCAPYEGIGAQFKGIAEYNYKKEQVLHLTEEDSLIIGAYYDKLFFPYRKVIESKMYDEESVKKNLPILIARTPVYYYSFGLQEKDIDFINRVHLADYGVKLSEGRNIFNDEMLWEIVKK